MSKKSLSGIALSKQRNRFWKNQTNPEFTDNFINKIEAEGFEWKEPSDMPLGIGVYNGKKYTIDKYWKIRGINWEEMKYLFYPRKRGPRIRIHKMVKRGDEFINVEKEVNILNLMKSKFAPYILGYNKAKTHFKDYILIPQDGNYENMSRSNLVFINKKEYYERGSKRQLVKLLYSINPTATDEQIVDITGVSHPHVYRVKKELIKNWSLSVKSALEELKQKTGLIISEKMYPIYQILLARGNELDNLAIAKEIFPDQYKQALTNSQKKALTMPIVRVRKKLKEAGLLERSVFEQKRSEAEDLLKNKWENWLTNKEIAEKLWLKKEQIDNLARQLRKEI